jgi:type VI secretion system protein VasD
MTHHHRTCTLAWAIAVVLVASACAKSAGAPKPSKTRVALAASADANPDATGKPSPVVVRLYQLKGDAAFANADFFALYDDEMKVLGPELIMRDEFLLTPSEKRTVELSVSGAARFVGVIAAFRDIRNSQWRVVVPAPLKKDDVNLVVERARVEFAPAK